MVFAVSDATIEAARNLPVLCRKPDAASVTRSGFNDESRRVQRSAAFCVRCNVFRSHRCNAVAISFSESS